jgi:hypothetical protein
VGRDGVLFFPAHNHAVVRRGCARAHTNSVVSYVCSLIPTNFSWNSGTCFPCCRKISNAYVLQIFLQHGCTWYKNHKFQHRALQHRCVVKKSATQMCCRARNLQVNSRNLYLNSSTNVHTCDHIGQDKKSCPVKSQQTDGACEIEKKRTLAHTLLTHTTYHKKTTQRCEPPPPGRRHPR